MSKRSPADEKMFEAIDGRDLAKLEEALSEGADPSQREQSGLPALIRAMAVGFERGVRRLVRAGAGLNDQDRAGQTALHWAVAAQWEESIETLMEAGIDDQIEDRNGWSAIRLAQEMGHDRALRQIQGLRARKEAKELKKIGQEGKPSERVRRI